MVFAKIFMYFRNNQKLIFKRTTEMKNLVLILAIVFCVSAVNVANAQLTKEEKKEWKKKKKKTSPEQFKRMYDENASHLVEMIVNNVKRVDFHTSK